MPIKGNGPVKSVNFSRSQNYLVNTSLQVSFSLSTEVSPFCRRQIIKRVVMVAFLAQYANSRTFLRVAYAVVEQ